MSARYSRTDQKISCLFKIIKPMIFANKNIVYIAVCPYM